MAHVETVMTAGNGFLLDRKAAPEGKSQLKRNSSTEDENQKRVALLVFRNGRYRIAPGSARRTRAALPAPETAPFDNAGT